MVTFTGYISGNAWSPSTGPLDITRKEQLYTIFSGAEPYLTPGGRPFAHASERMAQLLLADLALQPYRADSSVTPAWLFGFQKDIFEPEGDPFPPGRDQILAADPFVTLKATGKFSFQPFSPEDELFPFAFATLASMVRVINGFVSTTMKEIILPENEQAPFAEILKHAYGQLTIEKKVVLQAWSAVHGSGAVLPLLLATGTIGPAEYVNGLIALKICDPQQRTAILLDVTGGLDYMEGAGRGEDHSDLLTLMRRQGENDLVEFKSTLRWDIRAGKTNPAIERASLKTIAAFLNTGGGTLLIGVRDDGSVEGIETDKFANEDKFLLHLWTLIRTCLGREVSPYIRTLLEKVDERTVCRVNCHPSARPVFIRQPGFDEEFYIRLGPSTNAMNISEALTYIADRFKTS